MFCLKYDMPAGSSWINKMTSYDRDVIRKR
jgi:L-rhamnose isomerase